MQHIEKDHKNRKDIQEYTGLGQVIILKEKTQEDKATYDKIFYKGYRHTEKHLANIIKTVYNEYIFAIYDVQMRKRNKNQLKIFRNMQISMERIMLAITDRKRPILIREQTNRSQK